MLGLRRAPCILTSVPSRLSGTSQGRIHAPLALFSPRRSFHSYVPLLQIQRQHHRHHCRPSTSPSMVLAAVTQLTSGLNPLENADTAIDLIQRAAKAGAKVVFLPEATDFISSPDRVGELTYCKDNRTFVDRMLQAAKENNVFVSVGIHEPAEEEEAKRAEERRCYNTQLLINDKGDDVGRYRKTHMFDVEVADLKIKER